VQLAAPDINRCRVLVHAVAERLQARRSAPASAAAPIIFSTTNVPATPRRPCMGRVLDRDVVVDEHGGVIDIDHLGRHLEVHGVAGIILDDKKHALAPSTASAAADLVRRWRCEHLARASPRPACRAQT